MRVFVRARLLATVACVTHETVRTPANADQLSQLDVVRHARSRLLAKRTQRRAPIQQRPRLPQHHGKLFPRGVPARWPPPPCAQWTLNRRPTACRRKRFAPTDVRARFPASRDTTHFRNCLPDESG